MTCCWDGWEKCEKCVKAVGYPASRRIILYIVCTLNELNFKVREVKRVSRACTWFHGSHAGGSGRGIEGLTFIPIRYWVLLILRLSIVLPTYFLKVHSLSLFTFFTQFLLCITPDSGPLSISLSAGRCGRDAARCRAVICATSRGRCPSAARPRAGDAPQLRDLADRHGGQRGLGEGEATLVAGGRRRLVRGRGCG